MSYDIYCYRSKTGRPDEDEAAAIIEADEVELSENYRHPETKLAIVKALIAFNPKLEAFDFDYDEIAILTSSTIEEVKNKFDHIEINTPDGEPAMQITVFDNHVFITVPYWYKGEQAVQVLEQIKSYVGIIRRAAGYFVYDPQTGRVFDPSEFVFDGLQKYLSVSEHMDEVVATNAKKKNQPKRPWWKFW